MTFLKINKYTEYLIIILVAITFLATVFIYSDYAYNNHLNYQSKLIATAVEQKDESIANNVRELLTRGELVEANLLIMSFQVDNNIARKKEQIQSTVSKAALNKLNCPKNELFVVVDNDSNTEQIIKGDPDCKIGEVVEKRSVSTGRQDYCYNSQTNETYWCGTPKTKWQITDKKVSSGEYGPYFLAMGDLKGDSGTFYGLHGTNEEQKIGTHASAGCIRHYNADIIHLYNLLPIGTIVWTE